MIEGNLADVSLPGLLQFLATESNKSFKVKLVNGFAKGELFICEGELLAANFGILEGNDALTEFLFWQDGTFHVERVASRFRSTINSNLKIDLKQSNTFADQLLFLREEGVGLNTEIVPSPNFGTQFWQEALTKQPLGKDDFAVLGWITDGRTMRQAMREFSLDVVSATSSLYRLLITHSVECLRATVARDSREERYFDTEIGAASKVPEEEVGDLEVVTSDNLPAVDMAGVQAKVLNATTVEVKPSRELVTAKAASSESSKDTSNNLPAQKPASPAEEEPVARTNFDIRRTDPLPIVAVDIERLFQTSFHVSPFGQLALNNEALDSELKEILADFKNGLSFIACATKKGRLAGQVLHTCKYSLERGYIDPPDAVASITADLLLGRVEIEQYLLQRRRITGDELRDVTDLARQRGVKLVDLLVKTGFMTDSDQERLQVERERFAPR